MAEIFATEITDTTIVSFLPLLIVLTPIIGSAFIGLAGLKSVSTRNFLAAVIAGLTVYFSAELFFAVLQGCVVLYNLPSLAGVEMSLRVDLFGSVFALFSAFIWFLATLVSIPYMEHEKDQTRYYVFLILSLGGCLGVFLSGDFLSLFLFFELMTLAAYALVVHAQTDEAISAGGNYLYLGIIGGLSLLSGIILLNSFTGSVVIAPLLDDIVLLKELAALIAVLMIIGFGVKAGMVPLHIWLPQAHPVAPSPASALLSGIMIKTGAYGIIRVAIMLYSPAQNTAAGNLWSYTENLGHIIIWIGIITMLLAAVMAVLQNNAKRLLAYSSISQMGYILMGIGAAGYLGYDGPMGFGGFSYHIINHAFFKAGMFILFGVIYARLHEKNLDRLGGLWRKFPFTFIAFAVCAAGIMGIPGFNGYVSKTLLHHAIVYAYEYEFLWDLWVAEKLFMLTSGLTVCYIAKLFISIFLGPRPVALEAGLESSAPHETWIERIVAISFIGVISFLGLFSPYMLKNVVVPMADSFTYSDYYLNYLANTGVWYLEDLLGVAAGLALGAGFYIIFKWKDVFNYKPPEKLSVERSLYQPATAYLGIYFKKFGRAIDDNINRGFHGMPASLEKTSACTAYLDGQVLNAYGVRISRSTAAAWDALYDHWLGFVEKFFGNACRFLRNIFMLLFKFDYNARGDERFQRYSISNIDFDLYIILIVIGVILAASLLFIL